MNQSMIISLPADATDLEPHRRLKFTATGVAYAGATDPSIGTFLPSDPGQDKYAAIQLREFGIHFAELGNNTDVAIGDELEGAANGTLVKKTTGRTEAIALEAALDIGDVLRVRYVPQFGAMRVFAAGVYTWDGGAATAGSIAVPGILATDVVVVTLNARAGAELLALATWDNPNGQIDLTLSANGTNGTTKLSYVVLRP